MKSEKNILIAFLLNISFSILEIGGGFLTNSVAIISDAIHDFGDAVSIGISYILEKKSKRKPDDKYTYGYARYSILGAFITTTILVIGSLLVILGTVKRIISPQIINYDGMIILAILGFTINFMAAYFTKEGDSINQKAVNLHMLEDVLGWVVVLIGSILMKFTDIGLIDALMSLGVAIFILISSFKNFKDILDLFLEKTPKDISIAELKEYLLKIKDVLNVHHIHLWSLDGNSNFATMHIVTNTKKINKLKEQIREELIHLGINHVTIEIEDQKDECLDEECHIEINHSHHHHH